MIAAVCWTPFQIINTINYKIHYMPKTDMDIYICKNFWQADNVAKRLSELKYIQHVYTVKKLDYDSIVAWKRKCSILKDLFLIENAIQDCLDETVDLKSKQYTQIISSGYLNFNIYFNCYFKRKNAEIIFLDDGIETYLTANTRSHYSAAYKFFSRLTQNGGTNLIADKWYVYAPELVVNRTRSQAVFPLKPLEHLSLPIKQDLNRVFGYEQQMLSSSFVYFDQIGTGDFSNGEELFEIQNHLLELLSNICEIEHLLIKLHPRTLQTTYDNRYRILQTQVPWEVILLNEQTDNSVLISLSSTACLTPKLIFDKEPWCIFLFKLFPVSGDEIENLIQRIRACYRNPQRILIPNNVEEFKQLLEEQPWRIAE